MKRTTSLNKIAVAVSGGVDSSVAAYLLKRSFGKSNGSNNNNNIFGLHMSNWNSSDEESEGNYCEQSEKDARDARDVCNRLGIDMYRAEFVSEYWTGVFEPFVKALVDEEGQRMVNPDVDCNRVVKFGAMRDYAMMKGARYIATGHYARLWHRNRCPRPHSYHNSNIDNDGSALHELMYSHNAEEDIEMERLVRDHIAGLPEEGWICQWGNKHGHEYGHDNGNTAPLLLSGADLSKDQSYFLSGVVGSALSNAMFPLGNLMKKNVSSETDTADDAESKIRQSTKSEDSRYSYNFDDEKDGFKFLSVRDIAEKAGLPTATKKESMGICFVGKRKFADFITQYLPHKPQPGNFVDIDTGEIVGKHNGSAHFTVGQGAKISGASQKWFICRKDQNGTVFVCNSTHHPSLYSNQLFMRVNDFNWITGELPPPLLEQKSISALCRTRHLQPLVPCIVSLTETYVVINFDKPIRAITPGQTAALYVGKGLICLGGGQIWMHGPTYHDLDITLPPLLHPAGSNDLSVKHGLHEN